MARRFLLALDGGGIRGVLTARILRRIEGASPGFLGRVSLFAGTSTGGILALGLAFGLEPAQLEDLYVQNARAIFDDSLWDDLRDLGKLVGADYGNKKLRRLLDRTFGVTTLGGLSRRVLVSAFDLDNQSTDPKERSWKPKFFHNFSGADSDGSRTIVDVAMATSAAPGYFPTYQGYVDGGVVANNPSLAALAQLLDRRMPDEERAELSDIVLLSVGTGTSLRYIAGSRHDWGYAQWAKPLLSIVLEGSMGVVDFQCAQILGARYHRIAPVFPPGHGIALDEIARIPDLLRMADALDLQETIEWLAAHGT